MSQLELYAVLRDLGVDEEKAKAAVTDTAVVTKDFLKGELQELKTGLLFWIFTMLLGFASLIAAIVKWVRP